MFQIKNTGSTIKLIIFIVIFGTSPCFAQSTSPHLSEQDTSALAHRECEDGLEHSQQVFSEQPTVELMSEIIRCLVLFDRYLDALEMLDTFVREFGDLFDPDERREIEHRRELLASMIGMLSLDVAAPDSARVFIDGTDRGTLADVQHIDVDPGPLTLTIQEGAVRYYEQDITISPGTTIRIVPGTLSIDINLSDVLVTIDGDRVDEANLDRPVLLSPGPHRVFATRPGYEDLEVSLQIVSSEHQQISLSLSPLNPLPEEFSGNLVVVPSETNAVVNIDSEQFASTAVPIGPHEVTVDRQGFQSWSTEVNIMAGQTTRIEARLLPTEGYLRQFQGRAQFIRRASAGLLVSGGILLASWIGIFSAQRVMIGNWNDEEQYLVGRLSTAAEDPIDDVDSMARRIREHNEQIDGIELLGTLSWISIGLSVACLIAGLSFRIWGPDPDRYSGFSLTPSNRGVLLSGVFR